MKIYYVPSDLMTVQNKYNEILKKYGKEWNIREESNGNWLSSKKSDVLVNGKSYRDFVLDYYGRSKLTKKLIDKFYEDVKNEKVNI